MLSGGEIVEDVGACFRTHYGGAIERWELSRYSVGGARLGDGVNAVVAVVDGGHNRGAGGGDVAAVEHQCWHVAYIAGECHDPAVTC